ncbi:sensor histidine kinase [Siphonobacter aquaeclarae]|uniref:Histidine kinase n=1 Tax=Siphonobacter aquaeclarae TaxID=563176 RepID=A0A1G9HVX5_9BACT|nr:histidine kinase [Siphonobacter aquaeclarae]SDL17128.1 Histidine kinase [Siphonobacter aquaeclarae]
MTHYHLKPGAILSLNLSLAVLSTRLAQGQGKDVVNLVGSEIVIAIMCFAVWLSSMYILREPRVPRNWQKFCVALPAAMVISVVFYFGGNLFFEDYPLQPIRELPWYLGLARLCYRGTLVIFLMYPIAYYLEEQRKIQLERTELEELRREELLIHLEFLRQQMEPHFLLNSLSVLKASTEEESTRHFVVQLSNLYRYLLHYNGSSALATLEQELEFVRSYFYLLEARHEAGIQLHVRVSEEDQRFRVPPMALQTLIENAVKHNVVSAEQPLQISIYREASSLVVSNTLRLKQHALPSSRIGLRNLAERYRLLAGKSITVHRDETHFSVKLPLIRP